MEKIYCKYCGLKLETILTRFFNEETGEKEYRMKCMNVKCEEGCYNNGGHEFEFFNSLFISKCKRCGLQVD